ncbi:NAD(P)/FAD-dependent oxidoreductase [Oceanospirillum linum]|uniref:Amine oxidase domain-containing protein n=1 Tax=Oceanospirillum linum TaxID=966 RepID=A0A1T1HBI0_OCELI|nr:FAD-dependent oxidoreductase [Oceanospirillum linum]OOV87199.1 hypothetical protein BTA35_0209395 [Oceanospirillum linum]SEF77603.1 hypothetical protein SAMN04489856_102278 [Oleiphilus messinensis]SMP17795.1 hypothetical protein SAMN06264348_103276 [Oceanospirillum linum]
MSSSQSQSSSSHTPSGRSSASSIAIIGAGLAGCTLARQLANAGCCVDIFEKSRGTGGRLASSRVGEETVDLGASWLKWEARPSAHNLPFKDWLSGLESEGLLHLWQPMTQNFQRVAQPERKRYVGSNRLSALTRSLIDHKNIRLHSGVRVESVDPQISVKGNSLLLTDTAHRTLGVFDQVVVATPAPQAVPLLKAEPALQALAQKVQPDACWTLVPGFEAPLSTPIELFEGDHPILRRVVRDSRKPGRHPAEDTWVIQARADWSLQMVDDEKEHVQKDLEHAFHQLMQSQPVADSARCHRWLYSTCTSLNLDSGFLHDSQTGLSVCGDWLAGFGFEASWQSAMALSHALLSTPNK